MPPTLLEPAPVQSARYVSPAPQSIDSLSLYLWTPAQYRRMAELGVLTEEDKVELLEGVIVRKMTHNAPHDGTLQVVSRRLQSLIAGKWEIRSQSSLITIDSESEPDLAVVPGPEDRYGEEHPHSSEVLFVVEIANTSLKIDRRKAVIYARGGIPVYWIVNVQDRQLEVFSQPDPVNSVYLRQVVLREDQTVTVTIENQDLGQLEVRNLLLPVRH